MSVIAATGDPARGQRPSALFRAMASLLGHPVRMLWLDAGAVKRAAFAATHREGARRGTARWSLTKIKRFRSAFSVGGGIA